VSLALHKPVAVQVPKSSRAQAQDSVVEHVEDVDTREAAAGVSGSRMFNDGENGFSVLDRLNLKLLEVEGRMHVYACKCIYESACMPPVSLSRHSS
jgi:hypothetical protein